MIWAYLIVGFALYWFFWAFAGDKAVEDFFKSEVAKEFDRKNEDHYATVRLGMNIAFFILSVIAWLPLGLYIFATSLGESAKEEAESNNWGEDDESNEF